MRTLASRLTILAFLCGGISGVSAADLSSDAMFRKLHEQLASGNAEVKYNLGMFYQNGIGTARDSKSAFRYFLEAAEAGSLLASYKTGCYYAGQFPGTVEVNEELAWKYKLRAAEAGYDLAQSDIALHLIKKGDIRNAALWLERASRQKNIPTTGQLAHYLSLDDTPDLATGYALLLLYKEATPQVTPQLKERITSVEARLSPEEKTAADVIRASWYTGVTPLTALARSGVSAVPKLLTSLEH